MRSLVLAFAVLAATPALAAEEDAAALWTKVGYAWNAGRLPETASACDAYLKARDATVRKQAQCLSRKAYAASKAGDEAGAARLWKKAEKADPTSGETWAYQGWRRYEDARTPEQRLAAIDLIGEGMRKSSTALRVADQNTLTRAFPASLATAEGWRETAYIGGQSPALGNMVVKMLMEHFKGFWNRSHTGNNHAPLRDEVARLRGLTQSLPEAERKAACTLELRGVAGLDNEKFGAVPDDIYAPLAAACPR